MKLTKMDLLHILTLGPIYTAVLIILSYAIYDLIVPPGTIASAINETPVVISGENIRIHYNVTRLRSCNVQTTRSLRDSGTGIICEIAETNKLVSAATNQDGIITQKIPDYIPAGYYTYYTRNAYTCNFYHQIFGPYVTNGVSIPVQIISSTKNSN